LEKHWSDARYEETLAVLVSLRFEEERYQEIEEGIRWFVTWGVEAHRKDPDTLWKIGRSPIRTVLHILGRASISLKIRQFDGLLEYLLEILFNRASSNRRRETMKATLAQDSRNLPELLARLAADDDGDVRRNLAGNAGTPPELLARLAADDDNYVRRGVAGNAGTPPQLLAVDDIYVRRGVAGNVSTPPELLAHLATDDDSSVRRRVAENARLLLEDLL
jgi:hypothetical protein